MPHSIWGLFQQAKQVSKTFAAERWISRHELKTARHNAIAWVIHQAVSQKQAGHSQHRIGSPIWGQGLIYVRPEEVFWIQPTPLASNPKENTLTASRVNQVGVRPKCTAIDYFQQIPDECSDLRGREKLAQLTPPLKILDGSARPAGRPLGHWLGFNSSNIHFGPNQPDATRLTGQL